MGKGLRTGIQFHIAAVIAVVLTVVLGMSAEAGSGSFSLKQVPAYSGSPYAEVHGNRSYFSKKLKSRDAFEKYGKRDAKNRCSAATAMITKGMMPAGERTGIGHVRPSGWHTVKYPDLIADRYLYNRCHLIGFQLTGENGNEDNLITGTRYMNVEGMLPFENRVAECVRSGGRVLYRVTPIFRGDDLLASGVLMEAESVEGAELRFCVFCYNVQPGIAIDYADGGSSVDQDYVAAHPEVLAGKQDTGSSTDGDDSSGGGPANASSSGYVRNGDISGKIPEGTTYVLNTNTRKFHYTACPSVGDMAPHNTEYFSGSRDEAIGRGFSPCGRCKP